MQYVEMGCSATEPRISGSFALGCSLCYSVLQYVAVCCSMLCVLQYAVCVEVCSFFLTPPRGIRDKFARLEAVCVAARFVRCRVLRVLQCFFLPYSFPGHSP